MSIHGPDRGHLGPYTKQSIECLSVTHAVGTGSCGQGESGWAVGQGPGGGGRGGGAFQCTPASALKAWRRCKGHVDRMNLVVGLVPCAKGGGDGMAWENAQHPMGT